MFEVVFGAVLSYPHIDPVLVEIGGFPIRWYSLAYLGGLLFAWWWAKQMAERMKTPITRKQIDDFLFWATLGVIVGGRLGYVLFYKPLDYLDDPVAIFRTWDGGMSFHGGLLGVVIAVLAFCRVHRISLFRFADLVAVTAPVGLFLGRLANFINGELWGRASDVPWAMVFPRDPLQVPRHPSQLYEAVLEGLVLFALLNLLAVKTEVAKKYPGVVAGLFFIGYGSARYVVEFAREPDAHLGLFAEFISMGQILSAPMIAFGAWLVWRGMHASARVTGGSKR